MELTEVLRATNQNEYLRLLAELDFQEGKFKNAEEKYQAYFGKVENSYLLDLRVNYAYSLRKNGKIKEAMQVVSDAQIFLTNNNIEIVWRNYCQAYIHAFLGENEKAMDDLSKNSVRWMHANYLGASPVFENLWHNPRFKEIIRKAKDEIEKKRQRVHQLEKEGLLPRPEEYFKDLK